MSRHRTRKKEGLLFIIGGLLLSNLASLPGAVAQEGPDITLQGGDTTIDDTSFRAYGHELANLSNSRDLRRHDLGEDGFKKNFKKTQINGRILIGPKFNNTACSSCHIHNGRGKPTFGRRGSKLVVKVSQGGSEKTAQGGPAPLRGVGLQLRDHSIRHKKPDATLKLAWEFIQGMFADGTPYELRRPKLSIESHKRSFTSTTATSLRCPPPVFGMGLLDAVDAKTILANADPHDVNGDGVSGRANLVWDLELAQSIIGKFGWKAGMPTVSQQIAEAYAVDMGVSNPLIPGKRGKRELGRSAFTKTVFYTQTVAVPKARDQQLPQIQQGKQLFSALNCSSCHLFTLTTGQHSIPELSDQTIHPFTDLLLHDMGAGLADDRPEFLASGSEWRTAPLWGIGLTKEVMGDTENYLHDGRARSLEEAILWHGGEAEASKEDFRNATKSERESLIQFLQSL